jgi:hypothetical protein
VNSRFAVAAAALVAAVAAVVAYICSRVTLSGR